MENALGPEPIKAVSNDTLVRTRSKFRFYHPWLWLLITIVALIGAMRAELLAPIFALLIAFIVVTIFAARELLQSSLSNRTKVVLTLAFIIIAASALGIRTYTRYQVGASMDISVQEVTNIDYPEDPAARSASHGQYNGRQLTLIQRDPSHFDFVFKPSHSHIAKIIFRNVDVSLMTPSLPAWTKDDPGLRRIALTDRQWNRQQVQFPAGSVHLEIEGGDGFEKNQLVSAELAKNCLNAGLWEIMLFTNEGGNKSLYYQGWFTFPLGHYKNIFEQSTGLNYQDHFHYLEHWVDPAGAPMKLPLLRQVLSEREVPTQFDPSERIFAAGEQLRKKRTLLGQNTITWSDYYPPRNIQFASFIPPGRYSVNRPWSNKYWKIDRFQKSILREVRSPDAGKTLHELELAFQSSVDSQVTRFLVSGFDLNALPQLSVSDYPKGLYMPMGIGTPPFNQSYEELKRNPPDKSAYVSLLLDDQDRWIDHHSFAIDGVVLHRDKSKANVIHAYLLSYERQTLIGHFVISAGTL